MQSHLKILAVAFRDRAWRYMLVVCGIISIGLPVYIGLAIHPRYETLIVRHARENAIQLAAYLETEMVRDLIPLRRASFTSAERGRIENIIEAFELHKLKVFSEHGEVVYSTDPGDIGTINREPYFTGHLEKGQPFTAVVRKDRQSLDDGFAKSDMVECYVPIMIAGTFQGAFEVYFDIRAPLVGAEALYAETRKGAWSFSAVFLVFSLTALWFFARQLLGKRRYEQALKENEDRFRSMSASVHDALLAIDDAGRITFWNQAAEKMFGYAGREVLGKALHPLLAPQRYEDAYRRGFERFNATGDGHAVGQTLELTALRRGGAEFPIELSLSSYRVQGRWNAVGTVRDITARKRAESEKEKLIADLQQALDEVDTLKGIIPICQHCKSIRDDQGYWNQIESYISRHSGADLSHGICPDCARKHYPDLDIYDGKVHRHKT